MIVRCDNVECIYNVLTECMADTITLGVAYDRNLNWVQICETEEKEKENE